eukprot:1299642-Amphidinium_carterae.1
MVFAWRTLSKSAAAMRIRRKSDSMGKLVPAFPSAEVTCMCTSQRAQLVPKQETSLIRPCRSVYSDASKSYTFQHDIALLLALPSSHEVWRRWPDEDINASLSDRAAHLERDALSLRITFTVLRLQNHLEVRTAEWREVGRRLASAPASASHEKGSERVLGAFRVFARSPTIRGVRAAHVSGLEYHQLMGMLDMQCAEFLATKLHLPWHFAFQSAQSTPGKSPIPSVCYQGLVKSENRKLGKEPQNKKVVLDLERQKRNSNSRGWLFSCPLCWLRGSRCRT